MGDGAAVGVFVVAAMAEGETSWVSEVAGLCGVGGCSLESERSFGCDGEDGCELMPRMMESNFLLVEFMLTTSVYTDRHL